jgi:hypothetical protein
MTYYTVTYYTGYRTLVYLDFALAVLLTVLAPLALLALNWRYPRLKGRLIGYWRVSSLLMITVYLLIGQAPLGFVTGVVARLLMALRLVLPLEPSHPDTPRYRVFNLWRSLTIGYCVVGVVWTLPLLACVTGQFAWCGVWFEPVGQFKQLFHADVPASLLGTVGYMALGVYVLGLIVQVARAYRAGTLVYVSEVD